MAREDPTNKGNLKKPETAIGTGPFLLARYEPNVKTVFRRNPDYFRSGLPLVDGVDWLGWGGGAAGRARSRSAPPRPGHPAPGPWHFWPVRQPDVAALKKSHPQLLYQDFLSNVTQV